MADLSHLTRWPHKPGKYRWLSWKLALQPQLISGHKKSDHLGESLDHKQFLIPKWSLGSKMVTASTWFCSSNWATFNTLMTFHSTDWFIGILIMAYYPPYRTWSNPLYTTNNQSFGRCSTGKILEAALTTCLPMYPDIAMFPKSGKNLRVVVHASEVWNSNVGKRMGSTTSSASSIKSSSLPVLRISWTQWRALLMLHKLSPESELPLVTILAVALCSGWYTGGLEGERDQVSVSKSCLRWRTHEDWDVVKSNIGDEIEIPNHQTVYTN